MCSCCYRKLYKGNELISTIGLGAGGLHQSSSEEIEEIYRIAISKGINFFDLVGSTSKVFVPFGRAIKECRDKVYFQLHLGAVYDKDGNYGWSRNLKRIKETFEWELEIIGTDYVDFGFLHCIDDFDDLNEVVNNGILDYAVSLKEKGTIKHLGFSSHTPAVASKLIDYGIFDLMMFSINPAYDLECGDEYGIGTFNERNELFKKCEKEQVNISVMKPFFGGQLLDNKQSPFKVALTRNQCLAYCLDRPAVITALPGIRNKADLEEILKFLDASKEELDYSIISSFTPIEAKGTCVYCDHCLPCPKGIDIGLVNKYYDLALLGDELAFNHYSKLKLNASDCIKCGHCNSRCPFKVDQMKRMEEIDKYFSTHKTING